MTKSFSSEPEGVTGSSSTVGKTALEADAGIGDKRVARNLSILIYHNGSSFANTKEFRVLILQE